MIEKTVLDKLRVIGRQVKDLLPGVNGSVQFNVCKNDRMEPKVNVTLSDVTEVKK